MKTLVRNDPRLIGAALAVLVMLAAALLLAAWNMTHPPANPDCYAHAAEVAGGSRYVYEGEAARC